MADTVALPPPECPHIPTRFRSIHGSFAASSRMPAIWSGIVSSASVAGEWERYAAANLHVMMATLPARAARTTFLLSADDNGGALPAQWATMMIFTRLRADCKKASSATRRRSATNQRSRSS